MSDQQFGALIRALRIRLGLRQKDLAARAKVSQSQVSRIERGHVATVPLDVLRRVAAVLEVRIELLGRWRGGDLDRILSARHSALHESVARSFANHGGWTIAPEVSFSIFGERGVADLLAWNAAMRRLLVIELKTEIVDVNELVGTFDRKIRLALQIAAGRGWDIGPGTMVSGWVIVADGRTNRRRVHAHSAMLQAAYPVDGRGIRHWLARPQQPIRCLSFWPSSASSSPRGAATAVKRVSVRRRIRPVAA